MTAVWTHIDRDLLPLQGTKYKSQLTRNFQPQSLKINPHPYTIYENSNFNKTRSKIDKKG